MMTVADEWMKLIPEQTLDLCSIPNGPEKTAALEAAYAAGFTSCYFPDMDGPAGRAARYWEDEFKDVAGKDDYLFEMGAAPEGGYEAATEFGHVASVPACEAWARDRDERASDWLFRIFQNWGNCVDASLVELIHGALGVRAMDAQFHEAFRWLVGFYAYAFRGYCTHGWFLPAAASVSLREGYCFALPDVAGVRYLEENESELLVSRTWCQRGPPTAVRNFVQSRGWRFASGAISKFSGGVEGLQAVFRRRGQIQHGSNFTSAGSTPATLTRIGGHAQTAFGGDWSDRTLRFFRDQRVRSFSEANFPVVHHQTWGGRWSGAVADRYWPPWWGPKPQGAWITTAQQALESLFRTAYVYLPDLRGWPRDGPMPPRPRPPRAIELTGTLRADNQSPIRGVLTARAGDQATEYIIVPDGSGGYVPTEFLRE